MKTIHTKEHEDFAARIKQARLDAGLTQTQAAKKLGHQQPYISKVEAGDINVGVVELKQFAILYGKKIGYFLK